MTEEIIGQARAIVEILNSPTTSIKLNKEDWKGWADIISNLLANVEANEWQPKELHEKEGTQVVGWLTTDQGFQDVTVILLYTDGRWCWGDDEEDPVKQQDMILGVKLWPEVPAKQES